ncbi:hypothetical protein [Streptomyces sp. NPDC051098]|uniref:hypothetical protein n=1 Tax=Streptomyces sp. NPDC051098 TaxID=3155411 RepID=UPI00341C863F
MTQESANSRASDRAISKVRADESGHAGTERRLVLLGARPRAEREPGRDRLDEALATVGATVLHTAATTGSADGFHVLPRGRRRYQNEGPIADESVQDLLHFDDLLRA